MNVSSLEQVLAVMETAEIPPKSLIVLSSTAAAGPETGRSPLWKGQA